MFDTWYTTAGVRRPHRRLFTEEREQGLALFSAAEVPEVAHPLVTERGAPIRDFLLTQALYQYLLFTVHLETRVVNRALERIGNGRLGIPMRDQVRLDAYKIYTDEAYHALSNLDLVRQVTTATGIPPNEYRFDPVLSALDGPATALAGADGLGQLLQAVVFETITPTSPSCTRRSGSSSTPASTHRWPATCPASCAPAWNPISATRGRPCTRPDSGPPKLSGSSPRRTGPTQSTRGSGR
ncbi:MAG TPA: hypothetical protein VJT72_04805 [Pseudonocardiaceae bacterium]|nr:hypothetical protein [Pseudonocardiaceae bacterium]